MSVQGAPDLDGRTVVVTGASSGIGAAAARRFAALGAEVAVVGRDPRKTAAVADSVGGPAFTADFADLGDVRALAADLADRFPRIDVLANNAGGYRPERVLTADGHEWTFQVNHLAPFLLTNLLLDRLARSPDARVISTGSMAYRGAALDLDDLDAAEGRYRPMKVYGAAKLATILFTRELARRTEGTTVTASAFHPGGVASDVFREKQVLNRLIGSPLGRLLLTPEQGAEPLVMLATAPEAADGAYFHRLRRESPRGRHATDPGLARALWERSERMTGVAAR
ncbi:SDR family NAD(P)-dependent oxidoreductase [Glycomyces sp. A-F 0318]|uniref:SDR family NAD(P)-dependent oxidoreductase n=1 Tax=Glycomyces amatae TaxID=2881355 RepID=UPI001E35A796|nr:SDR family NAD(P)-dependent oxidoreductase [Glycomyces amatae]MCD0444646.1 SDR family NAD(P)-dependent oxidoreductase [Glycomyces amatae]